ncbi:TPA: flagellin [Stenotrophomonas maltophilia]|nr:MULTISPECIES: flagellin [Stenotrophomonas]
MTEKADELKKAGITVTGSAVGADLKFSKADGSNLVITQTGGGFPGPIAGTFTGTEAKAASYAKTSFTITGTVNGAPGQPVTIDLDNAKTAAERATQMVNAINAKTHETGVSASLVDGTLQLTSKDANFTVGAIGTDQAAAKTALAQQTGLTADTTSNFAAGVAQVGFAELDISNQANADNAILAMDAALQSVNSARADLGAIQNRFTSTIANLNTNSENLSAARSRIRDVDYAQETAELTRGQILQQAGTAMLAQANQVPQNVLRLLQS